VAPTNAQLTEENERLRARVAELETAAGRPAGRPVPAQPSFGLSEGERQDIEMHGSAVSPFDGKRRGVDDLPDGVTVDPAARQREQDGPAVVYGDPAGDPAGDRDRQA